MAAKKQRLLLIAALAIILGGTILSLQFFLLREPPNYTLIEEGLYLGGRVPSPPPGTRAVLNLCEVEDAYRAEVQQWSPIKDAPPAPSITWLREQVDFVDRQRRAGLPTYVHCMQGVSRSALVVAAYEMQRHGWTRDQALDFILSKRFVNPNPAFRELLLEWEKVVKIQ